VTDRALEVEALDGVLAALLSQHPGAILAALAEDGGMVPVPDVQPLSSHPRVPVPAVRANMLGLVVPADRMVVVAAWERGMEKGLARSTVRMLDAPERPVTLVFLDLRHKYGVRLGVLVLEDEAGTTNNDALVVSSLDNRRPRTATLRKNLYANITAIDERASRMLGWSAEEMVGQRSLHFLHPDDHERAISNWLEMSAGQATARGRVRHLTKDEGWLWVEVEHTYHFDDDPELIYIVAQLSDISDEMAAHEATTQREKLFRRMAESLPVGLFQVLTDETVVFANGRLARILGVPSATTLAEQLATVVEADRPALDAAFLLVLHEGIDQQFEVGVQVPDVDGRRLTGVERRVSLTLAALSDQEGAAGAIVTVSDVTEAARMREELNVRATFDPLTGCYNRASTMAGLEKTLADGKETLAVIFIDLDRFKPVNDELGHAAGDELLVHVAQRLSELRRTDDVVGRIGGDEFLLICHGVGTAAEAQAVAERVSAALHHEVIVGGRAVDLAASIGVALSAPDLSAGELIELADTAMYESKRLGDGTPVLSRGRSVQPG
jgi:diguanylate cyclase (GGDEF)-like protein/PAS domain S-box-containing protein